MTLGFNQAATFSAINAFARISAQLALSDQRLATGNRITRAADDPAGVIAVAQFDDQLARVEAATRNGERISSIIDTADGAMAQISSLLGTIQSSALAAAGSSVTAEERAAYQAEIDAAVDAIDTLVNTTTFNGTRLLDGGIAYTTSGIDNIKLADVRVQSASAAVLAAGDIDLDVQLVSAAQKAVISYTDGALTDDVTFSLTGDNGTEEFSFASGASIDTIAAAVNALSDATGIEAQANAGTLYFRSTAYGSDASVAINVTAGTFDLVDATTNDSGQDASVTVNGQTASADGLTVFFGSSAATVRFSLTESFNSGAPDSTSFSITGGGAQWQLSPDPAMHLDAGLASLRSTSLGSDSLGYLRSLKSGGANALASGNYNTAANIASSASSYVATERARLGALQSYSVDATLSSLAETETALTNARSSIMDVDYAAETANNSRLQILYQASAVVLASLQSNAQTILSLLG